MQARNINIQRDARMVLENISLTLNAGEVIGVLGANGAGKSTLLGALAGELPIASGSLEIDSVPLRNVSTALLARRRAVLPQSSTLNFDLAVTDVVAMGAYPFPEVSSAEVAAEIAHALSLADATALQHRRYLHLSGGEQQRIQFARSLVQSLLKFENNKLKAASSATRYLFLDEPTASLDPRHQQDLLRVVVKLAKEKNLAVLAVLHDVNLAARWCDRLLLLAEGRAIACGAPNEVLQPTILRAVYKTDATVLPHPSDPSCPLVLFD